MKENDLYRELLATENRAPRPAGPGRPRPVTDYAALVRKAFFMSWNIT